MEKEKYMMILIAEKLIAIIKFFLDTDDENVVFLNEINNANENMTKFEKNMRIKSIPFIALLVLMNLTEKNHPYGCTIAITRNNSFWKKSESIDLVDYENKDLSFANKSVILKNERSICYMYNR